MKIKKDLIIQKITGLSKEQLFLNSEIPDIYKKDIEKAFLRLEEWEPIEYILEEAEFYSISFYVDSRVLIPRNDTEVMVDEVLEELKSEKKYSYIDVWTWSSCIPIAIIQNSKNELIKPYVVDVSKEALEVSKINIERYYFDEYITQIHWDLLTPFLEEKKYKLKENIIITANLPYIKDADYESMDKEVIKYEPKLALYGWKWTWFELYQKLISQCLELKEIHNIILFIEIGFDQKRVAEDFLNNLWLKYEIFKDSGDIDRCIKVYF